MDVVLARVLSTCLLLTGLSGCQSAARNSPVTGKEPEDTFDSPAALEHARQELESEMARWARHDYAVERAIGARCPSTPDEERQSSGLIRGACRGEGPAHLVEVLKAIEARNGWSEDDRLSLYRKEHWFVAIPGLGERPDFMMVVGQAWIRSLEGPDPDTTHFLVRLPLPVEERVEEEAAWPVSPVRDNCSGHSPLLKLYAVKKGGLPQNVTTGSFPPPPVLTVEESRRYGPYIARIERACDSHIYLETSNLQYVSTMRWSITDFDPETSLPASDERSHGNLGYAHFGFLVWNGLRFEARDRVSRESWPCSTAVFCGEDRDRFVIESTE